MNNHIQLTNSGRKPYSKSQIGLFVFVPKDGSKITSSQLVIMRQRASKWRIDNPRPSVVTIMDNLIENIKINKEPFRVRKSRPRGPYPAEYWIEELR